MTTRYPKDAGLGGWVPNEQSSTLIKPELIVELSKAVGRSVLPESFIAAVTRACRSFPSQQIAARDEPTPAELHLGLCIVIKKIEETGRFSAAWYPSVVEHIENILWEIEEQPKEGIIGAPTSEDCLELFIKSSSLREKVRDWSSSHYSSQGGRPKDNSVADFAVLIGQALQSIDVQPTGSHDHKYDGLDSINSSRRKDQFYQVLSILLPVINQPRLDVRAIIDGALPRIRVGEVPK